MRASTLASARACPTQGPLGLADPDLSSPALFPDVEEMKARAAFALDEATLIRLTKAALATGFGTKEPARLAETFRFVGPVVGPLSKREFVEAFSSFEVLDAFPDMAFNYYEFRVDPWQTNRVWFTARSRGTNTGKFAGVIPASGKVVETPPQSCSMLFNETGEVVQLTIGYVMDKNIGNTGGLGGVYGLLYAIGAGLPFPEAQPWTPSLPYQARARRPPRHPHVARTAGVRDVGAVLRGARRRWHHPQRLHRRGTARVAGVPGWQRAHA